MFVYQRDIGAVKEFLFLCFRLKMGLYKLRNIGFIKDMD